MTTSARASVPPAPIAPAPDVKRQPAKVRLLLVDSALLPPGLSDALGKLHFESVPVDSSFGGLALRRSDVVVFPGNDVLAKVAEAIASRLNPSGASDRLSVIVLDKACSLGPLPLEKFDVDWIDPCGEPSLVAKRLANCASEMLVVKGVARRKGSTTISAVKASVAPVTPNPPFPGPPAPPEPQRLEAAAVAIAPAPGPFAPTPSLRPAPLESSAAAVRPVVSVSSSSKSAVKPSGIPAVRSELKPRTLTPASKSTLGVKSELPPSFPAKWGQTESSVKTFDARESVMPASEEPTVVGLSLASLTSPAPLTAKSVVPPARVERVAGHVGDVPVAAVSGEGERSGPRRVSQLPPFTGRNLAVRSEGANKPEWETSRSRSVRPPTVANSIMPKVLPVEGSRWLLLDDDVARAHAVAKSLEAAGAEVLLSGTRPTEARVRLFRQFGATGVIVEEACLEVISTLFQRFQQDGWLRGVNLVTVRWQQLYDVATQTVDVEALKLRVLPHWQPEHDALEALALGQSVSLGTLAPAKLLREVSKKRGRRDVSLACDGTQVTLKLDEGLLWSLEVNGIERLSAAANEIESILRLHEGSVVLTASHSFSPHARDGQEFGPLLESLWRGGPSVEAPELQLPAPDTSSAEVVAKPPADFVRAAPQTTIVDDPLPFVGSAEPLPGVAGLGSPWQRRRAELYEVSRVRLGNAWNRVRSGLDSGQTRWKALHRQQKYVVGGASVAVFSALIGIVVTASSGEAASAPPVLVVNSPEASSISLPAAEPTPRPEANLDKGAAPELEANRKFPKGCERWLSYPDPKVQREPAQAKSTWHAARRAVQVGDWSTAEELLCRSSAQDPKGAGPIGLADLYLSRNNIPQAEEWASWALFELPKDSKVKQMLADVRSQQGRTDEARALLHDSMSLSAADELVLKQVAKKYATSGYKALRAQDPNQARRIFRRASVLDATNGLSRAGLAEVALRDGDEKAALAWATEAVNLDPDSFEAQLVLGDAQAKNGQPGLAKQAWLEAARISPRAAEVRKRLGL